MNESQKINLIKSHPFINKNVDLSIPPVILGEGSFGIVFSCKLLKESGKVAVKYLYTPSRGEKDAVLKEVNIMKEIQNFENIVKLISYYVNDYEGEAFIIMEEADRTLEDYLQTISEDKGMNMEEIIEMLTHLVNGLKKAKSINIAHLDIKPANILIFEILCESGSERIFKLNDWGGSTQNNKGQTIAPRSSVAGTPRFSSPEFNRYLRNEINEINPEQQDVYSLGMILLRCCGVGNAEIKVGAFNLMVEEEKHDKFVEELLAKFEEKYGLLCHLIRTMLIFNRKARSSLEQIGKYLDDFYSLNQIYKSEQNFKGVLKNNQKFLYCVLKTENTLIKGYYLDDKLDGYGIKESDHNFLDEKLNAPAKNTDIKTIYIYKGDLKNDVPNGHGTYSYKYRIYISETTFVPSTETIIYEGEFYNGKIKGKGSLSNADGYWSGIFLNGQMVEGVKISEKGLKKYEGSFVNWEYSGYGKIYVNNRMCYEGGWKKGVFFGEGIYYSINGQELTGVFDDHHFEGEINGTTFNYFNGEIREEGNILGGIFYQKPQEIPYLRGTLMNLKKEGQCHFVDESQNRFNGFFINDKLDGDNCKFGNNRYEYFGQFKEGKIITGSRINKEIQETYKGKFKDFLPNDEKGRLENNILGYIYEGGLKNGSFDGDAQLIFDNEEVFEVVINHGLIDLEHCIYKTSQDQYKGAIKLLINNSLNVNEIESFLNTCQRKIMYQGKGILNRIGDFFEGEFQDGNFVEGKITYKNLTVYNGTMLNGNYEGENCKLTKNNAVYEGLFKLGHFLKGKITYQDGSIYEGEAKDENYNGEGKFIDLSKKETYEGIFLNHLYEGKGKITYETGDIAIFEGNFKEGKKEGNARIVRRDGNIIEAVYSNDEVVSNNYCPIF